VYVDGNGVTLTDPWKSSNVAVLGCEPVVLAPHADTSVTVRFASTALPLREHIEVSAAFLVGTDPLNAAGVISTPERFPWPRR